MMNQTQKVEGMDLLHEARELMQEVHAERKKQQDEEDFNTYLIDVNESIIDPTPILSIDGMTLCSVGNISTIVGEAKSKKTFLCSALVAGFLHAESSPILGSAPRSGLVLWVDTEQSRSHVQLLNRRILHMGGYATERSNNPRLKVLALREMNPEKRRKLLFDAINELNPRLVVIDGISDLLYNTNDLEECEGLVSTLMRTSSRLENHILMVLHTNPNSDKARGHIGSALQRKSESVIYVRKVGDVSIVEPQFCRNEPFDRFAFRINSEGIPVEAPIPSFAEVQSDQRIGEVIEELQKLGGSASREVLIERLTKRTENSRRAISMRLLRLLREGKLEIEPETELIRMKPEGAA